ncbi:MAG TPA: hypothetical protein VMG12_26645, partial [Polyangiaceae bacterium]|nr:hypothetical protein [Polyangiaceae bacterium]
PLILPEDRSILLPSDLTEEKRLLVLVAHSSDPAGVVLRWYRARDWDARQGVALGRFARVSGRAEQDGSFRPVVARPLARPHTFSGQTIPGETAWQPWIDGSDELGVQVRVDTSAAGFSARPHYFAEAIAGNVEGSLHPSWFASISEPTDLGFTLRLLLRGIAVQGLKLADPHQRVTKAESLNSFTLEGDGELKKADPVVRLLPVMHLASLVESLPSGGPVSLDGAVPAPDGEGRLGVCMLPRTGTVDTVSDREGPFAVRAGIQSVSPNDVLLLSSDAPNAEGLVTVIDIVDGADGSLLVLNQLPANAKMGDRFGLVGGGSAIEKVDGVTVTVKDVRPFAKGHPVIVRRDQNASDVVIVEDIPDDPPRTLELSRAIRDLKETEHLSVVVQEGATISEPLPAPPRQRVTFAKGPGPASIARFRAGDLVAPESGPDVSQSPPWVEGTSKVSIVLRGAIEGLQAGDVLMAATVSARATVRNAVSATREVTVDGAARFRDGFVARITADWVPKDATWVTEASGTTLKLPQESQLSVSNGHVIGRCDFPRSVRVLFANSEREIGVSSDILRAGDVIMRVPKPGDAPGGKPPANVTWVESASGSDVVLASPLVPLAQDDVLVVANPGPVVLGKLESGKLELTDAPLLRVGDAIGEIATWRQSELDAIPARVVKPSPFTLDIWPDGLLPRDVIGLTSAVFPVVVLRIDDMPELQVLDEVSMSGLDVAGRESLSGTGFVFGVDALQERVGVLLFEPPNVLGREFRAADITATAPFLRGSALKLIRNQDLFVSWLAVEDAPPMPRAWVPPDVPPCPCSPVKETNPRA